MPHRRTLCHWRRPCSLASAMTPARGSTEYRLGPRKPVLTGLALAFATAIAVATPPADPRGRVAGLFTVLDADVHLPEQVTLRALEPLIPYPGQPVGRPHRQSFSCPVAWRQGRGAWSCELPAATYDLAVGAPAFVPQLRQAVEVRSGATIDLGAFALEKGSSVEGWLVADDQTLDAERCLVRVLPAAATNADASANAVEKLAPPPVYLGDPRLVERRVERDGTFRISNVRPGTWAVEVRCPGYATAQLTGVTVRAGREEQARPAIALERRLSVEVTVVPPVPEGAPFWSITMWRVGNLRARTRPSPWKVPVVDRETGRAVFPNLAPGRFEIQVRSADGLVTYSEVATIREPEEARRTIVPPPAQRVEITGTVTHGKEAVDGWLSFTGPAGQVVEVGSDERGRFAVELPSPGRWRVEMGGIGTLAVVEIPRQRRTAVTFELPDNRIAGRVVDDQGKPVAYARVTVAGRYGAREAWSGEGGEFAVEYVQPGAFTLAAELQQEPGEGLLVSPPVAVEVAADRTAGPITLRLAAPRLLRGQVASADPSGVATEVGFQPDDGPPRQVRVSGEGRFAIPLSATTRSGTLIVRSADSTVSAYRVATNRGAVEVQPERESGALEVDLPHPLEEIHARSDVLEISRDGARFAYTQTLGQAAGGGCIRIAGWQEDCSRRTVLLPKVAPGLYRVCLGPAGPGGLIDHDAAAARQVVCDGGLVEPGGELQLSVE